MVRGVMLIALDDPAWAARVGAAGRERVKSNWSWVHTAKRTVELYREVLADHDAGGGRAGLAGLLPGRTQQPSTQG